MKAEECVYSDKVPGTPRNHGFIHRFDVTGDGYVGITQFDGDKVSERVLLSPPQVQALWQFLRKNGKAPR